MRKLVSYSLFFLVTWQIIGFVAYFEFTHYHLKKEIKLLLKQGVPKEDLIIFNFDENQMDELIWLKKNEFDLNGNLFDVVRSHKTKDGLTYMECISDKKETILFANLGQEIASNMGDDHHPTPLFNWLKILHFPLISFDSSIKTPAFHSDELKKDVFIYHQHFSTKSIRLDYPPPCNFS